MQPIKLHVQNFTSYVDETINFDTFGSPFILLGENGAGKSSIIDMITSAIFFRARGADAKGTGMDELIKEGADSFKLDYTFLMNDQMYNIIREKSKKGQKLELYINGENHTGKLNETQQKINDIFRMDYDTFMDTLIIGQGDSARFMKKTATERKKVIAQILRLDKYDVLESYTKDIKKGIKEDANNLSIEINRLYDSIKNKDLYLSNLVNYKDRLGILEGQINKLEKELENELIKKSQYEQKQKQQEILLNRKRVIVNNISACTTDIEKFKRFQIEIENILSQKGTVDLEMQTNKKLLDQYNFDLNNLQMQLTKLETENKILLESVNELKTKYSRLKNYNECSCEFCGQQISDEYKTQHLLSMKEQGHKKDLESTKNKTEIVRLKSTITDMQRNIITINSKVQTLEQQRTKIAQAEVKKENVISRLADLNNRLKEMNVELLEMEKINIDDSISDVIFKDSQIRSQLNTMRQQSDGLKSQITTLNNSLEVIKEDERKYNNCKQKYDEAVELLYLYDDLQKSWSKDGIQAIIIDSVLPHIEEEINKYLAILSDNKISIKFETLKTAKNGNTSETLDIIVSDISGTRAYERYSGGEKTRIDFACHIGMSKFLAKRSGANMDFFIVDEGIGTLDDAGKNGFIDTIRLLTTIFKQVAIISHIDDIKETFDNKVLVTKDIFNGSKVNII